MLELKLDRVSKHYKQKIAVDRLEFTFRRGIYGLLGANGAGKTTLLRMMVGVMKPTSGEILCNGQEIGRMAGEYRMKLGYLPQELGYYPNFTVLRYLEYLAELKAVPPELARERIEKLLKITGLEKAEKEKKKTLSGGMIRRLGIAQSLLNDPEVLILDEPGAALDMECKADIRRYLIRYMAQGGAVILTSHETAELSVCTRMCVLRDGKLTPIEKGMSEEQLIKEIRGDVCID